MNHTNGVSAEALGYQARRPADIQLEQAGQEIVNSISIHKLEGDDESGILDDVVAVITNNDKTIRIWSLTQHSQNTVLELPFAVNHATISPDGRTLVAVGDYQQAYFYERVDLSSSAADSKHNRYASSHSMWELLNIVSLHVPRALTTTGYFTTAWSPSGNLCAVASECGYVSVIDMLALHECEDAEDAIAVVMASSRPETTHHTGNGMAIPGAIRTMIFAPPPWDLLIWAEDQGKVCLADLRTGLRKRQTVLLDPELDMYERVEMDPEPIPESYQRHDPEMIREYVNNYRSYRSLADDHGGEIPGPFDIDHELALAADSTSGRTLAEGRSMARAALRLADDTQLSRRERELLDSLRTTAQTEERERERIQERDRASPMPRSIHYSELRNEDSRRQSALFTQDFPALARQNEDSTGPSSATLPNTIRIMRDYMRSQRDTNNSSGSGIRAYDPNTREQDLDDALAATATTTSAEPQPPTLSERATLYQGGGASTSESLTRSSASRLLSTLRTYPFDRTASSTQSNERTPTQASISTSAAGPSLEDPSETRRRRAIFRARERALAQQATTTSSSALTPTTAIDHATLTPSQAAARYHTRLGAVAAGSASASLGLPPPGSAGYGYGYAIGHRGDNHDPALGLRTAGLAMSGCGRWLWVACEKGVFELEVDLGRRRGLKGVSYK